MKIPQHKIDQIKQTADIVEVISQYVNLKLRGKNYVGLCPFHNEKTPSFTVSPDKQIFHCFGCGTGGDVIAFVKTYEKISYVESIQFLANRYQIDLPVYAGKEADADRSQIEALYFIHETAMNYFTEQLFAAPGMQAREYLKHRGLDESVILQFKLGYAPDQWDGLLNHLKSKSIDLTLSEKAGLIISHKERQYYDRFRHRLVFPIHNISGRVIAFGARLLTKDPDAPKYLNSPESLIYHKGKVLYGLYQAREAVRAKDEIIIVEGYADCISMHQYGIRHVTASSGTAFTREQANLIRRYTQNVVLIFDGDAAGIKAAERGGAILLEAGLSVKIVVLPPEHDPDSFVREYGRENFEERIQKAASYLDFRVQNFQRQGYFENINKRTMAAREMLSLCARFQDPIRRNLFMTEIADTFALDHKIVQRELNKAIRSGRTEESALNAVSADSPKDAVPSEPQIKLPEKILRSERGLIRLMLLEGPETAKAIFRFVRVEDFQNPAIRRVAEYIFRQTMMEEPYSAEALMSLFPETIQKALTRLLIEESEGFSMEDCVAAIQSDQIQKKIETLRFTIKTMESQNEDISQLLASCNTLQQQLNLIRQKKQIIPIEPAGQTPERFSHE